MSEYYIQRHISICGNCLLWWRKGGCGYTMNIDEAEVFNEDRARKLLSKDRGEKYTAWEKSIIDASAERHINTERLDCRLRGMKKARAK